jgi:ribosomal RNA-processing protein 36
MCLCYTVAEKRKLLVKARYNALAAEGGKGAVRKAIEKKQRKIGQKEKKSRPFAPRKRPFEDNRDREGRKRIRTQ